MGYTRFIAYGNNVELYEYEKDYRGGGNSGRKCSSRYVRQSVDNDGISTFRKEQERVGKRKDSARRASLAFRRLVLANLGGADNPILVTFTYSKNITDLRQGYKDFTACIQSLRYRYGSLFKYIAVPEFQMRGAVHFHALFWGITIDQLGRVSKSTKAPNLLNQLFWPHGFVFAKETDGHERLSSYLVKYMTKAFLSSDLKNQKCYVSSRNCLRPVSMGGVSNTTILIENYIGIGAKPIDIKKYETSFLGECTRSLFFSDVYLNLPELDFNKLSSEIFLDDLDW